MTYYSHTDASIISQFSEALLSSLAPDGGLWMPSDIPAFEGQSLIDLGVMSFADCSAKLARHFVDDKFSDAALKSICTDAYDFDIPIVSPNGHALDPALSEPGQDFFMELFHGPTLAFKDFAARFMARCASHIMKDTQQTRTILVATSGDTGGAIGDAFLDQDGIRVIILYPKGGVSSVQEQQLTTIGMGTRNVSTLCVDGSFDACQALVKEAFASDTLSQKHHLMSANSINVGRVIPQSFYYFWSSLQVKAAFPHRPIIYAIPSGNLGNLTGGLIARRMGAPIDRFVIGHNINAPFVYYLADGEYRPAQSVPTLSNAMDIGRPNNFPRILDLFDGSHDEIAAACWGASVTDQKTEQHLRDVYEATGYIMCPHTAVGHYAMTKFANDLDIDFTRITVATAHPSKFANSVERILERQIDMPDRLADVMNRQPVVTEIEPTLDALSHFLDK